VRLIKMIGLAAIAALASMAFLGASTASAETNTVLCLVNELECPTEPTDQRLQNALVHLVQSEGFVGKLLSSLGTILCLEVLATALVGELATAPEQLAFHTDGETHKITYVNGTCGTNSTHTNCTVTEEKPGGLLSLLKTGPDFGILTVLSGKTHVVCSEVGVFKVKVDCVYDGTGVKFEVGEQMVSAQEKTVNIVEGSFFCPSESKLDALMTLLPWELEGGEKHLIYIAE
jgi:hypothetical protein